MFQKKLIIFFFIISVTLTLDFVYSPVFVQAQDQGGLLDLNKCTKIKDDPPVICLQVKIGALDRVSGISEYISNFYKFFVGAVATLAIFMIVIGGVRWLFARGNPGKIGAAKKTIESAVLGMLLVFVSVALLRIINPDLISLKVPGLYSIKGLPIGGGFCRELPDMDPANPTQIDLGGSPVAKDDSNLKCGTKYKVYGSRVECWGHGDCVGGEECVFLKGEEKPRCFAGAQLLGTLNWIPASQEGNPDASIDPFVRTVAVYSLCSSGDTTPWIVNKNLVSVDLNPNLDTEFHPNLRKNYYEVTFNSADLGKRTYCFQEGQIMKGFAIGVLVNERLGAVAGIRLDVPDDWFILKKGNCSASVLNVANKPLDPTGGNLQEKTFLDPNEAYSFDEFMKSGVIECNISIDRTNFPAR